MIYVTPFATVQLLTVKLRLDRITEYKKSIIMKKNFFDHLFK